MYSIDVTVIVKGEIYMLVEFRVKNFKNFRQELVFRLDQVKNYGFNINAIENNIIKTSIVYGKNGSGKTNLGLAIYDIKSNIQDNSYEKKCNYMYYCNLEKKIT